MMCLIETLQNLLPVTYCTIFPVSLKISETIKAEACLFHSLSQPRWVGSLHYGGCLTLSSFSSSLMQTQCTVGSTDTSFDKGTSGQVSYHPSEGGRRRADSDVHFEHSTVWTMTSLSAMKYYEFICILPINCSQARTGANNMRIDNDALEYDYTMISYLYRLFNN